MQFRDEDNHAWTLKITVAAAKRVRDACDFNLLRVLDEPDLLHQLADDPLAFVDVLYAIVRPQAEARGIDADQFAESLAGPSIEAATEAFLQAIVSFSPPARRRALEKVLKRAGEVQAKHSQRLNQLIDDGTLDKALDEAMTAIGSMTSTESPAPPESTPTR